MREKGLDVHDVVRMIESDAAISAAVLKQGQGRSSYVNYNGRVIEYAAYRQPDGKVRIGSIRSDPEVIKVY